MQSTNDRSTLQDEWQTMTENLFGYTEVVTTQLMITFDNTVEIITRREYWYIGLSVWVLMCSLGIVGNTVVIVAFTKFSKIRKATDYLICNLALSDLVLGMLGIVYACYSFTSTGSELAQYKRYACLILMVAMPSLSLTSGAGILAISFERVIAVLTPLRHLTLVTHKRVVSVIGCIWAFYAIITGIAVTIIIVSGGGNKCRPASEFLSYMVASAFAVPMFMVIVSFANAVIICVALRRFKNMFNGERSNEGSSAEQLKEQRKQYKITRMLLTIVGSFYICWCPMAVVVMHGILSSSPSWRSSALTEACRFLHVANTFINPIIYASQNDRFKKAFKAILKRNT